MADKRKNESGDAPGVEDREEIRRESERVEQQDLNQGTDTGTHDATRRGVKWGDSYRGKKGTSKSKKA